MAANCPSKLTDEGRKPVPFRVTFVAGEPAYTEGGEMEVMLGRGFPPVPIKGTLIVFGTPATEIFKVALRAPMAEGVKVIAD